MGIFGYEKIDKEFELLCCAEEIRKDVIYGNPFAGLLRPDAIQLREKR
jgi:hypothetical protein